MKDVKVSELFSEVCLERSYFPAIEWEEIWNHSVGEELRRASVDSGSEIALVEITESGNISRKWNFGQLYSDALLIARNLLKSYKKGDRIAVWSPNNPEWVLLEFAVAIAGMVLVTVNPSYQGKELKYILEKSSASAVFVSHSFRGNPMWDIALSVISDIDNKIETLNINTVTTIYLKESPYEGFPAVLPTDPFQIQYTSGTTGFPKGVVLSHQGLLNNARFSYDRLKISKGDKFLNNMPLFHCASSGMAVLGCLTHRIEHFLMPNFNSSIIGEKIESEKITHWGGVPTMFVEMIKDKNNQYRDFSSLQGATSGGSNVSPTLARDIKARLNIDVQVVYGQTEASPLITMAWPHDSNDPLKDTVGQPLPHMELAILDLEGLEILPVGKVGEICCRGYNVMPGYYNDHFSSAKVVSNSGWLRTGDLGVMDKKGYLRIRGRSKEMIIRGGENIYPKEIENSLLGHIEISEVAVLGIPDKVLGEVIVCFIKFKTSSSLDANGLKKFIRKRLSPQKTPKHWIKVMDWPLTGSGKIRKFILKEKFLEGKYEKHIL